DGTGWVSKKSGAQLGADNGLTVGYNSTGNVGLGGTLSKNTAIAQESYNLNFTSSATSGSSHFTVDGSTFNVDAVKNSVGLGTATPVGRLNLAQDNYTSGISTSYLTPGLIITGPTEVGGGFSGPGIYFEGKDNNVNEKVMKVNLTRTSAGAGFLNFQSVSDNGSASNNTVFSIGNNGNVVVGLAGAIQNARFIVAGTQPASGAAAAATYFNPGSTVTSSASYAWTNPLSIYATGSILSGAYIAAYAGTLTASDSRIKHIKGLTNNAADLATLSKIKITDYVMIDQAHFGDRTFKKVIAQQLESVYPSAITKRADYIPDVYSLSEAVKIENGTVRITLNKAHGLQKGDEIKLVTETEQEVLVTVTSVTEKSFTVSGLADTQARYFVYGKKVPDFRVVDYDALSMLNVSATQELSKQLQYANARIAQLTAQVAELAELRGAVADLRRELVKAAVRQVNVMPKGSRITSR
ncbi:hypothetical protein CLV58_1691, partial [Spirosoma oryzae]